MTGNSKRFIDREFAKHVLTLMTGTGLGQVIALVLIPVVTRFYTPEDFSTLEQFAMLQAILVVFATGKYEFAIMLPEQQVKSQALVRLAIRISVWFTLGLLVVLYFTKGSIATAYDNPDLENWLLLLPIAIFTFAIFNTLNYWFSKKKQFGVAATSKVLHPVVSEPAKIAFGAASWGGGGLVVSVVLGRIVTAAYMVRKYLADVRGTSVPRAAIRQVATEYRKYPVYTIWGSLFGRLAQWAHIFMFSYFFGIWAIGFFALSRRLVQNPLNILSNSFSQVFYQRISEIKDAKQLKSFYFRHLWRFSALAGLMILVIQILPDNTMGVILGDGWEDTMVFLKVLCFWFGLNFISGSLSFINHRLQKQEAMFVLDLLHFILIVGTIWWSFDAGYSALETLTWFVIAKCVFFTINIFATVFFVINNKD